MPRLIHITTVPHTLHFLIGQIGYMREAGIDVEVISSLDEKLDVFLKQEPVRHHAIEMSRSLSPLRDLVSCWRLYRVLRQRKPDIVHVHTPKAGLLGMLAACLAGVPIRIHHIHGLRFTTLIGWRRQLVLLCEMAACRMAHQVFCVSPSAMQTAIAAEVVPADQVQVLLSGSINGMDAAERFHPERLPPETGRATRERLSIPADAIVIGYIGRFVRDKGLGELATAWQKIRKKDPKTHLLLVGYFEDEDPLDGNVRSQLENDERVHILGYDPETPPLYAAMDIFCLPTYREGLPYVLLEASAMQLPIVATRVTGCVDAVKDGETGTLVKVADTEVLAKALLRYVEDEPLRKWHGRSGRNFVLEHFEPRAMWKAVLDEYTVALKDARCSLPVRVTGENLEDREAA